MKHEYRVARSQAPPPKETGRPCSHLFELAKRCYSILPAPTIDDGYRVRMALGALMHDSGDIHDVL
jgi:hypothetical protein